MKVIDLLNKIANGEIDYTTKFDAKVNMGYCGINEYFEKYPINENYLNCEIELNDEVEILEEEKKIPEQIECYHQYDECVVKDKFYQDKIGSLVDEIIIDKINEIIDYLKSKGDE